MYGTPMSICFPATIGPAKVARALEESQAMVVLLTRNAVNSSHVKREMAYALGEKRFSNRLIPVFVGDRAGLPTHDISVDNPSHAQGRTGRPGK